MFWSQVPRPFTGDRSPSSLVFIFQRDVSSVPGKDIPGMQNEQEVYFFKKVYIHLKVPERIFTVSGFLKEILKRTGSFLSLWHRGKFKFFKVCIYPCPTHFREEKIAAQKSS